MLHDIINQDQLDLKYRLTFETVEIIEIEEDLSDIEEIIMSNNNNDDNGGLLGGLLGGVTNTLTGGEKVRPHLLLV